MGEGVDEILRRDGMGLAHITAFMRLEAGMACRSLD